MLFSTMYSANFHPVFCALFLLLLSNISTPQVTNTVATPNTIVTATISSAIPNTTVTATAASTISNTRVTTTTPNTTVILATVDLSNSNITSIPPDFFKNQSDLQQVDLSNNQISFLNGSIFAPLVNLETLLLSNNAIRIITPEVFRNLTNLMFLDLSQNALKDLPENLFVDNTNLEVLGLDGNNISTVRRDTFAGLSSLKQLFLNTSGLSSIHSSSFAPLLDLEELYLQENDVTFRSPRGLSRAITEDIFRSLQNLRVLDLSKNSIRFLPDNMFVELIELEVLHLDGNDFRTVRENSFTGLRSLQKLFLNNTGLSAIHPSSFVATVELIELYLQDNNVECLPWDGIDELNLTVLDLKGNNLVSAECSCDELPYCNPDVSDTNTVTVFPCCNTTLGCRVDPGVGLCVVTTVTQWLVLVVIILAVLMTLFIIILILCYNRKYLQVWMYMKCGWRFDPKDDGDDKTYDAFISYSNRDELVVIQELSPELQKRGFKLCLHYRDFPVGACIATTIIESVEASRRTIILLSQNFVDSEWCALEFKAAHRQVLEDRRNRIVVIVLDDLELQNVDKDLQFYLKTNTYLKWGDPWFWSKLCYALPRVGRGAPESHSPMFDEEVTSSNVNIEMADINLPGSTLNPGYDGLVQDRSRPSGPAGTGRDLPSGTGRDRLGPVLAAQRAGLGPVLALSAPGGTGTCGLVTPCWDRS
ncbi:toll-like receptor Tollo [Branchiostoma lanceolatum]|uniref:toll-like receptor Tollo n=1 Tax=Branchiostoma lanceolatum TaxID=7740 RepID=UPI00345659C2